METVSNAKIELAAKAAAMLESRFLAELPDSLRAEFTDLFTSLPNKRMERFVGLLAGVPENASKK